MSADTITAAPKAAGSSFYAGMRVLPKAEREAMYGIYHFCREVDDIADDQRSDRVERMRALDAWRRDLDAVYAGDGNGRAAFLAAAIRRFGLARADFEAIIDGMAMDVERDIRWPATTELDLYCDRVAVAVGRLSIRVFGMALEPGLALAHHLGRALQFTNILRDIDEDAAIGRVYLPGEALAAAGVPVGDVAAVVGDPRIDLAAHMLAARARAHFREAEAILAARPAGYLIAPRLMAAAYAELLRRMMLAGWAPPRVRARHNRLALFITLLKLKLNR